MGRTPSHDVRALLQGLASTLVPIQLKDQVFDGWNRIVKNEVKYDVFIVRAPGASPHGPIEKTVVVFDAPGNDFGRASCDWVKRGKVHRCAWSGGSLTVLLSTCIGKGDNQQSPSHCKCKLEFDRTWPLDNSTVVQGRATRGSGQRASAEVRLDDLPKSEEVCDVVVESGRGTITVNLFHDNDVAAANTIAVSDALVGGVVTILAGFLGWCMMRRPRPVAAAAAAVPAAQPRREDGAAAAPVPPQVNQARGASAAAASVTAPAAPAGGASDDSEPAAAPAGAAVPNPKGGTIAAAAVAYTASADVPAAAPDAAPTPAAGPTSTRGGSTEGGGGAIKPAAAATGAAAVTTETAVADGHKIGP